MKKIINILLLVIWMVVIFMFSQDKGFDSSNKSYNIANYIVEKVNDLTGKDPLNNSFIIDFDDLIVIIRKSAHFLEYLLLGILMFNVLKDYNEISFKILLITIIFCFIYAISDEIHQLFIENRTGKFSDVLIDTSGSTVGVLLLYLLSKKKMKKKIS